MTTVHDHAPTMTVASGHHHAGHDPEMFRRRFWLTLVAPEG